MKRTKNMAVNPSTESYELFLYAVNTGRLYQNVIAVVRNLARKYRKGIYDPDIARDAYYPIACEAAKMYQREFCTPGDTIFSVSDRFTAAAEMEEYYRENVINNDL